MSECCAHFLRMLCISQQYLVDSLLYLTASSHIHYSHRVVPLLQLGCVLNIQYRSSSTLVVYILCMHGYSYCSHLFIQSHYKLSSCHLTCVQLNQELAIVVGIMWELNFPCMVMYSINIGAWQDVHFPYDYWNSPRLVASYAIS